MLALVQRGYLPRSFLNYRQNLHCTFDIETLEKRNERQNDDLVIGTFEEAVLRPVSIGCSNNINGEDEIFLRQSSHPDDAETMVHEFLDYLFGLVDEYHRALPIELDQAYQKLVAELATMKKFSKEKAEKTGLKNSLKPFKTLAVYGFNSGEFIYMIRSRILTYTFKASLICLVS